MGIEDEDETSSTEGGLFMMENEKEEQICRVWAKKVLEGAMVEAATVVEGRRELKRNIVEF